MQDREASESAMAALWSGGVYVGEGTWFSRLRFKWLVTCMVECTLHMHVSDSDCPEFRDEIPFKEGRM